MGRNLMMACLCLFLGTACDDGDSASDDNAGGGSGNGADGSGGDGSGVDDSGGGTATCAQVLLTQRIESASSDLTVTLDGAPVAATLVPSAVYMSNPVWDAGTAPAACGQVMDGALTVIMQLEDEGEPVLRLQMLGVAAGDYDLEARDLTVGSLTGFILDPAADDSRRALSFSAGRVAITPDPLAAGAEITIDFDAAGGDAVSASNVPFTMAGTLTLTVPGS